MQVLTDIIHVHTDAPVERIIGQKAQVTNRERLSVSRDIQAEWIEVNFPGDSWPEEHARLNLFPIEDGQFFLQLLYLQYGDTPGTGQISWIQFLPEFFQQYPPEKLMANPPFRFDQTTEQQFTICAQTTTLLHQLREVNGITTLLQSLHQNEITMHLLRRALECITLPFSVCAVPACRFLAHDSEREKIMHAQLLIQEALDNPMTIKELSRKVAMNECYLKKGFKALVGKTIHEYQQELRIGKAKELLKQQGQSVSDVANMLGFSSISHFSTAFKKATGMKPCELLS